MTSLTKITCAIVLAGGLAAPAVAAQGDAGSGPTTGATATNDAGSGPTQGATSNAGSIGKTTSPSSMNGQSATKGGAMHVAQKMRDDLTKAGFTDIQIMPSSFVVRAKNSSGNPMMMVINPDSVTAFTEENGGTNSASSSSHAGGTNNGAGATPGPSSTGGSQPVTPGASQTKP